MKPATVLNIVRIGLCLAYNSPIIDDCGMKTIMK